MNDQLLVPVIALPAVSLTAVVIAAVKVVESASEEEGLNVAVFPSELSDTAPDILVVPCFNVKDELVTVELCTGSLNVAVTEELNPTPVAPSDGLVLDTVGGVVSVGGGGALLTVVTVILPLAPRVLLYGLALVSNWDFAPVAPSVTLITPELDILTGILVESRTLITSEENTVFSNFNAEDCSSAYSPDEATVVNSFPTNFDSLLLTVTFIPVAAELILLVLKILAVEIESSTTMARPVLAPFIVFDSKVLDDAPSLTSIPVLEAVILLS